MKNDIYSRTRMVLGEDSPEILAGKKVMIFGLGGVGGFVCEALARCGVGTLELVDFDTVKQSNINRQIIALHSTLGKKKTEVMRERINDINPKIKVACRELFYLPGEPLDLSGCDYICDCIDTVAGKVGLIKAAGTAGVPIISVMGCGGKTDITALRAADIYKTEGDALARAVRAALRKEGVGGCKVVFSPEKPISKKNTDGDGEKSIGSVIFVPSAAGLLAASEIVKDLLK